MGPNIDALSTNLKRTDAGINRASRRIPVLYHRLVVIGIGVLGELLYMLFDFRFQCRLQNSLCSRSSFLLDELDGMNQSKKTSEPPLRTLSLH